MSSTTIATTAASMPNVLDESTQHITTTVELIPGDVELATVIKMTGGYIISIDEHGNPCTTFDPTKHTTKFVYDKTGLIDDVHIVAPVAQMQQTLKVVIRNNITGITSATIVAAHRVSTSPSAASAVHAKKTAVEIDGSTEAFIEKDSGSASAPVASSKRSLASTSTSNGDKKAKKEQIDIMVEGRGKVKHGYKKRVINAIFKDLGIDAYYQTHTQPQGNIKKICYIGDGSQKAVIFNTDPEAITHASELQSHDILTEVRKNASKKFPSVMALPANYFSTDADCGDDDDDVAEM